MLRVAGAVLRELQVLLDDLDGRLGRLLEFVAAGDVLEAGHLIAQAGDDFLRVVLRELHVFVDGREGLRLLDRVRRNRQSSDLGEGGQMRERERFLIRHFGRFLVWLYKVLPNGGRENVPRAPSPRQ